MSLKCSVGPRDVLYGVSVTSMTARSWMLTSSALTQNRSSPSLYETVPW